jgi:uncharacterized protein with HEPN domain
MTERSPSEVLQDILEAIADIETFTATIDFEAFRQNREKVLAVVKAIEILGEAVKKISEDTGELTYSATRPCNRHSCYRQQ